MAARKVVPILPEPTKVRRIQGTFAWLDHRLLREGHLERMTLGDVAVYVFLVLAANREGCSFYRKDQACKKLGIDWDQFEESKARLLEIGIEGEGRKQSIRPRKRGPIGLFPKGT